MEQYRDSYTGFAYDGIHSSDLGLIRVSNSSRYNEDLLPEMQDKTNQIGGNDGTYYYGSYYTKRTFSLNVAFDNLTDEQLRKVKRVFGDKGLHKLTFDENPYKYYLVKPTGMPNFKVVMFTEEDSDISEEVNLPHSNTLKSINYEEELYGGVTDEFAEYPNRFRIKKRLYKGEGSLNFTAYYPFAKSTLKYIDKYEIDNENLNNSIPNFGSFTNYYTSLNNIGEWINTVHLIRSDYSVELEGEEYLIDTPKYGKCLFYNPGDLETPFIYKVMFESYGQIVPSMKIKLGENYLRCASFTLDSTDYGFQINSKLHLIEGLDVNGELSGKIYNQYLIKYIESGITYLPGDFFNLPTTYAPVFLEVEYGSPLTEATESIEYDYLFY